MLPVLANWPANSVTEPDWFVAGASTHGNVRIRSRHLCIFNVNDPTSEVDCTFGALGTTFDVFKTRWKPHKSKDQKFLRRSYTQKKSQLRKNIFSSSKKSEKNWKIWKNLKKKNRKNLAQKLDIFRFRIFGGQILVDFFGRKNDQIFFARIFFWARKK